VTIELGRRDYDAVVFDMDGVITDTASVHERAWKNTFDAFLRARDTTARPFDHDDYIKYVDGRPRDSGVDTFLRSRDIALPYGTSADAPDAETVWGVANRKNREFMRTLDRDGVVAFDSSVRLVKELQAGGFKTAIISASRNAQRVLDAAGLGRLFPVRVDGIELEHLELPGKPDPAMFLEAARRLHVDPDRSVVVEDAVAGCEAGREGGFALVIGVDRGTRAARLHEHGAHVVVNDLAEVRVVD
jgi:alpha,alpha-trehalase